jgi:hypothetical protein
MTEVSSQIQVPAALPPAVDTKHFEGTVHGMNFSLWIPLRIRAVRNSSYSPERCLQLHNFKIRSTYILDPETHLDLAPVQSNLQNNRIYSDYCT